MLRSKKKIILLILAAIVFLSSLFLAIAPKVYSSFPSSQDLLQLCGISAQSDDNTEKIVFLNVGQGDGVLLLSEGHAAMIDCGTGNDDGIQLINSLRKYGVRSLDYLFLSHPHSDHIGGSIAILNTFTVGTIYCPEFSPEDSGDSALFNQMIRTAQDKAVPLQNYQKEESISVGSFTVKTIWCDLQAASENNCSAVLKVSSKNFSALFTGDIEAETEQNILAAHLDLQSNLLKIGHHGSSTSSCDAFLSAVQPGYAVISVGENTFGHPSKEITDALKAKNIQTYRTDVNGDISFYFTDKLCANTDY